MYLLDTSTLSELIKQRPNHGVVSRLKQEPPERLFTAAICLMELRYGAALRADGGRLWHRIQADILPCVHVVAFAEQDALAAGDLLAHGKRTGKPVGVEDVLIAAMARTRGYTVVTRNMRHFQDLPQVKVVNWFREEKVGAAVP
jgi:predicted nucleic acid-binding protein